jgi:hypothetical protein
MSATKVFEIAAGHALHCALRADRHERGRLHRAVRCHHHATARAAVDMTHLKGERRDRTASATVYNSRGVPLRSCLRSILSLVLLWSGVAGARGHHRGTAAVINLRHDPERPLRRGERRNCPRVPTGAEGGLPRAAERRAVVARADRPGQQGD